MGGKKKKAAADDGEEKKKEAKPILVRGNIFCLLFIFPTPSYFSFNSCILLVTTTIFAHMICIIALFYFPINRSYCDFLCLSFLL